jgi:hypothetical protein
MPSNIDEVHLRSERRLLTETTHCHELTYVCNRSYLLWPEQATRTHDVPQGLVREARTATAGFPGTLSSFRFPPGIGNPDYSKFGLCPDCPVIRPEHAVSGLAIFDSYDDSIA